MEPLPVLLYIGTIVTMAALVINEGDPRVIINNLYEPCSTNGWSGCDIGLIKIDVWPFLPLLVKASMRDSSEPCCIQLGS